MKWVNDPADCTDIKISILPHNFDTQRSGCVFCGGTLDVFWICNRCNADHFPAVKRLIKERRKNSGC